ncbi:DMT family transporter [Dokdonella sp. MW10]|uniref:DMT family transporter n=1 Tax=Dokdonella sp. MW10 TaxID=2992926 RepID=UPI003F7D26AD
MTATRETPPAASATLHGIAAIVLWSSLAVLALGTAVLPPFQVLATSFGIAGMAGMLALVTKGRAGLAVLRQPVGAFALATVALYGYHALYFVAFRHAPALEANLVNYLWPLLIVVFAALLPGERLRAGAVAGTLIGLAGVVVMLTRGQSLALDPAHRAGYLAAFAAALTWAAYSVLNRRYRDVPSAAVLRRAWSSPCSPSRRISLSKPRSPRRPGSGACSC